MRRHTPAASSTMPAAPSAYINKNGKSDWYTAEKRAGGWGEKPALRIQCYDLPQGELAAL